MTNQTHLPSQSPASEWWIIILNLKLSCWSSHMCAHIAEQPTITFFFYIHLFLSSQMNRFRSCFFVILMVYFSTVILLFNEMRRFVISLIVLINTSDSEVRTAASLSSSWISSIHLKKKLPHLNIHFNNSGKIRCGNWLIFQIHFPSIPTFLCVR